MAKGAARFEPGAAAWTRREPSANMELEMIMSPEDGALLARATVENASGQPLEVQVTGFCEIALSARADDEAHPGFEDCSCRVKVLRRAHCFSSGAGVTRARMNRSRSR